MEPTAAVRQRKLSFSERMVLSRWDRGELGNVRVLGPLMLLSLLLVVYLGSWDGLAHWERLVRSQVDPALGAAGESMVNFVAVAGLVLVGAFVLLTIVLGYWGLFRGFKKLGYFGRRAIDPDDGRAIEIEVRNARFVKRDESSASRPWVLIAVAPGRVLYYSPWTRGELHPPSPVDSLPRGEFPSEFRLVLHAWHRSILRLEAIGPLAAAIGTVRTDEFPLLPDGGITRSPRDRWALFEGDIDHPAALRRIECNSVDAIGAALALATAP